MIKTILLSRIRVALINAKFLNKCYHLIGLFYLNNLKNFAKVFETSVSGLLRKYR